MLWSSAECKVDIASDVPGLKRPLYCVIVSLEYNWNVYTC